MTFKFIVYWIILLTQVIAAAFMYNQGIFHLLAVSDPTMISFIILGIHTITMISIGFLTYLNRVGSNSVLWYISEAQLGLGMIGTLIGFVLMFSTVFVGIATPDDIAIALGLIASGVGTALWTTLTGLISSLLIKAALVNSERVGG
jgi:hypothetical protein